MPPINWYSDAGCFGITSFPDFTSANRKVSTRSPTIALRAQLATARHERLHRLVIARDVKVLLLRIRREAGECARPLAQRNELGASGVVAKHARALAEFDRERKHRRRDLLRVGKWLGGGRRLRRLGGHREWRQRDAGQHANDAHHRLFLELGTRQATNVARLTPAARPVAYFTPFNSSLI